MATPIQIQLDDGTMVELTNEELNAPQGSSPIQSVRDTLGEAGRVLDQTVRGGVFALPNIAKEGGAYLERQFPDSFMSKNVIPVPQAAIGLYEKLSTPTKPTTEVGKALGNVGEATVGAFMGPGSLIAPMRTLAVGVGAGAGGEAAARVAGDESPLARIAGSIVGGGIPAAVGAVRPSANQLIAESLGKMRDRDWKTAVSLDNTLLEAKIPNLKSQLLGDRSTLADLVAASSGNSSVRPTLLTAVEKSPLKSSAAVEKWKLENLPAGVQGTRGALGDVQKTASEAINKAKQARGKLWQDTFDNAGGAGIEVPKEAVQAEFKRLTALASQMPNTQAASMVLSLRDKLKAKRKFITDGSQLNAIMKDVSEGLQAGVRSGSGVTSGTAKYVGGQITAMRENFGEAFAPIREANAAFKQATIDTINPMKQGLAGQLAEMGGGVKPDKFTAKGTAINMVFPKDVSQGPEIAQLAVDAGPEVVLDLFRESLSRSMQSAVKLSKTKGSLQQPFSFVQSIAGTKAQRENLNAVLKVAADFNGVPAREVKVGFYKLMKALETTKHLELGGSVDKAAINFKAGENVAGAVIAPRGRFSRYTWENASDKTYQKIAEIVTAPDGLAQLRKIADAKHPELAKIYARSVLVASQAGDKSQPAP